MRGRTVVIAFETPTTPEALAFIAKHYEEKKVLLVHDSSSGEERDGAERVNISDLTIQSYEQEPKVAAGGGTTSERVPLRYVIVANGVSSSEVAFEHYTKLFELFSRIPGSEWEVVALTATKVKQLAAYH